MIALVVGVALLATSCGGRERQADRLYRKAVQAVDDGDLEKAVGLLGEVLAEYPDTEVARRAEEDMKTYSGLVHAVERYPTWTARDQMILLAQAVERYRARNRKPPENLASMVPKYLDTEPIDPWGRPFIYYVKSGGRKYVLASLGSDGKEGGQAAASDIVIENGRFIKRGDAP